MKKVCIIMVLVIIFGLSHGAVSSAEDMEVVGNVTYNTFDLTVSTEEGDFVNSYPDDLESGFGFQGGIRYWINSMFGFEGGLDYAGSSTSGTIYNFFEEDEYLDVNISLSILGPYGRGVFKLTDNINIMGGLAYYFGTDELNFINIAYDREVKGASLGGLFGAEFVSPVAENIEITGGLNYRIVDMPWEEIEVNTESGDIDEEVSTNMSGLNIKIGISYLF